MHEAMYFPGVFFHLQNPAVDTGNRIFHDAGADLCILGKAGQHDRIDLLAFLPGSIRTAAVMGGQHIGQGNDPFIFALAARAQFQPVFP